jgi:hypothetical protein
MTDIVERLRNEASIWISSRTSYDLLNDAIAEIERLRNAAQPAPDLEGVRSLLEEIEGLCAYLRQGGPDPMDLEELSDAVETATRNASQALHLINISLSSAQCGGSQP